MPDGECPHCGMPATNVRVHCEETLVSSVDGEVHATQRSFLGECPTHGTVFAKRKTGHHSTIGSAKLRKRYPPAVRDQIVSQLSPAEARDFKLTMRGHRRPMQGEVERWDRLAIDPKVPPSTAWMTKFEPPGELDEAE